ncbi:lipopolysaccharide biosynthesis protein [Thermus caliditerrae]|uniref:lipopolysaccharide biosynthesis protein n=1 Tax=Thermus caliditerrae TaxID=1330700 RepID=UPI001F1E44B6|nr:oligosaccharide flippase family protein [Thermus caliditerrae]
MKFFLARPLLKGSFIRGVLAIAGSTALAQGVAIISSPILTRLYEPSDLGVWGLFVSYIAVVSALGSLRYEVAVVAAKEDQDARQLASGSLFLVVVTSFLGALVFEWMRRADIFGFSAFPSPTAALVFLTLLFTGFALVFRYYAMRKEAFSLIGRFTVVQGWAKVVLQLLLAPLGTLGLLLGETFSRLAGLRLLWGDRSCCRIGVDIRTLIRYWRYPVFQLSSSILNTLASFALVPVFVMLYGSAVGGALALAQRVVGLPVTLIGGAVGDVFYGRAASLLREDPKRIVGLFLGVSLRLGVLGFFLGAAVWFLAPKVTPWLFGPGWKLAGDMMGVMGPWMAAQLAVSPVSRLVFLTSRAWLKLVYDTFSLLVVTSPIWLWNLSRPEDALKKVSLLMVSAYMVYFFILLAMAIRMGLLRLEDGDGS